jgi:hypothetical protein
VEHILYEIEQFMFAFELVCTREGSKHDILKNKWWRHALLESCLLHARNLLDLFETPSQDRYKDDVLAVGYGFVAQLIAFDPSCRHRLNKDLAHITYARVGRTLEEKTWQGKDFIPLLERTQEFLQHLLSRYLPLQGQERQVCQRLSDRIRYMLSQR